MELRDIKGFGDKRLAVLEKVGITNPLDLLTLFPIKYFDKTAPVVWDNLKDGDDVTFIGELVGEPKLCRVGKSLSLVKATFLCEQVSISCTWFNQPYVSSALLKKRTVTITGKVKRYGRSIEISAPVMIPDCDTNPVPIYRPPKGISQSLLYYAIDVVLSSVNCTGYVSREISEKYGLMSIDSAFKTVHRPQSISRAVVARKSLAVEKLAYVVSLYHLIKNENVNHRSFAYADSDKKLRDAVLSLPYRLTYDQTRAVSEILSDLKSDKFVNTLLQGDVGSGKTIVAFLVMLYVAFSGKQSVLMAPTEILAKQHYLKAETFFKGYGINVALLLGSQKISERKSVLEKIRSGDMLIIIGTHAVLNRNVEYKSLSLTVVDEQHKFGVCQRGALSGIAENTDNIVMSATPIPRTLALSLYGQLKTVMLKERPSGSFNVITSIVPSSKLNDMYEYVLKKARDGEKTYIVCPRISGDDGISAVEKFDELVSGKLKECGVALLHGEQSETIKSKVMREFVSGEISVLVSTTVIEVGIDVPEATTMVIFGAERFGLAQLHQLRGRIGRDGRKSYCFIVTDKRDERIDYLCAHSDGFELAEYDFTARGAGDFLGTRQHGKGNDYYGVKVDSDMIDLARKISEEMLCDVDTVELLRQSGEDKKEYIKTLSLN